MIFSSFKLFVFKERKDIEPKRKKIIIIVNAICKPKYFIISKILFI